MSDDRWPTKDIAERCGFVWGDVFVVRSCEMPSGDKLLYLGHLRGKRMEIRISKAGRVIEAREDD